MPDEPDNPTGQEETRGDPLEGREDLQNVLKSIARKVLQENLYARLIEVRECAHDELYWQGAQYIWWSNRDRCMYSTQDAPGISSYGQDLQDSARFEFVTNIYQSKGLGAMAAITGAVPTVRFSPEDADRSEDLETARAYDKLSEILDHWNPPKLRAQDESYYFWCNGIIGLYTEYIQDANRFGTETREVLEEGEARTEDEVVCPSCSFRALAEHFSPPVPCPQCGVELTQDNVQPGETTPVPEEAGSEETAKGRQIIEVVGALELHRPQWAKEQAQFPWIIRQRERHYSQLRAENPDIADKIKPGSGLGAENDFERSVRLYVAEGTKKRTQSSEALAVLTTQSQCWFRPELFWTQEKKIREELLEIFPNGVRVEFAGDTYTKSVPESMDARWRIEHAYPGPGQHRPSMGSSEVSVQDRVNTNTNIMAETYEYGIPITYRSADTFDQEANEDQRAEPGQEVQVIVRDGQDIRTKILQVRADSVSPDMYKHAMDLIGPISQEMTGVLPAVVGEPGQGAAGQTASGYSMQRDQAMGRMGIPYSRLKQAEADIKTCACRDLRKNASGKVKVSKKAKSGDFETIMVDLDSIEGEATAFPEGDEAFPQTWGQKRETVMQIMDTPYGAVLLQEPANADTLLRFLGVPELTAPQARAVRKTLADIAELTQVQDGEDVSVDKSIDPDPLIDDIATEAAVSKRYLQDEIGRTLRRENPQGFQNVRNYLAQRDALVKQQAASAPPPMKPMNTSITVPLDKMVPEVQAQFLAKDGIQVTPQDFAAGAMLQAASKGKMPLGAPQALPPLQPTGGLGMMPNAGNGGNNGQ